VDIKLLEEYLHCQDLLPALTDLLSDVGTRDDDVIKVPKNIFVWMLVCVCRHYRERIEKLEPELFGK
jgi:hypothetical protein